MLSLLSNSFNRVNVLPSHKALKSIKNFSNLVENYGTFEMIKISRSSVSPAVFNVQLANPKKRNSMNFKMWNEIETAFAKLSEDAECRSVVLIGQGACFSSGIDVSELAQYFMTDPVLSAPPASDMADMGKPGSIDIARKVFRVRHFLRRMQQNLSAVEKCRKPVVCGVHGACIGGGINLAAAADIRLALQGSAWFQIKEVQLGLAADVGILQRAVKSTGNASLLSELALTGRRFEADEAVQLGFVSRVVGGATKSGETQSAEEEGDAILSECEKLAAEIAEKSPVAVQGTKEALIYARDHSVQQGLDQMSYWNQVMLLSDDLKLAALANMTKQKPEFSDL